MPDPVAMADAIRRLADIAQRRLLYRHEQAAVDEALRLADTIDIPAADPVADLRQRIIALGFAIYDDAVAPATAAFLLNRSVGTLANWRTDGTGPGYRRMFGGRVRYPIPDLADFMRLHGIPGVHMVQSDIYTDHEDQT